AASGGAATARPTPGAAPRHATSSRVRATGRFGSARRLPPNRSRVGFKGRHRLGPPSSYRAFRSVALRLPRM
ncbi:MAG: hypothetical protein AVDCRST_MAG19-189, partial [uncultured Thermomicrobiales bacterium]